MSVNDATRIIIDNSTVMLHILPSLTDDSRGLNYNRNLFMVQARNTKGGSITVPLTSCLTGFKLAVLTFFVFICKTD